MSPAQPPPFPTGLKGPMDWKPSVPGGLPRHPPAPSIAGRVTGAVTPHSDSQPRPSHRTTHCPRPRLPTWLHLTTPCSPSQVSLKA